MSTQYPGGFITKSPVAPTQTAASGIWTIDQATQNIKAGTWPIGDYFIERSLRFNSADSTYLNKTWSANGSRTIATASFWFKKSSFGVESRLIAFDTTGSGTIFWLFFNSSDQLQLYVSGTAVGLTTTQVFRDPSAWYHIVVGIDTTQATGTDRIKLYVNGSQVTAFTGTQTYYAQNATVQFNNTAYTGYIGWNTSAAPSGYMTEFNWIDGQALTPSSFGLTNANTGVWGPKAYAGTYGSNGFELNFSDNSNTTAATLGKDYSGNGNNWTPNNFSVTAGAGNDSLVDTPTPYGTDTGAGGTVRGNYCTWNALAKGTGGSGLTLSNGNLDGLTPSNAILSVLGTIGVASGKWYWEVTPTTDGNIAMVGIGTPLANLNSNAGDTGSQSWGYYGNSGDKFFNGTNTAYGATFTNNDVIGVALDMDAGTVVFYKNGASQGTAFTGLTGTILPMMGEGGTIATVAWNSNFGQRAFAYTAPSGFKALCTQNLPTPTIGATAATQAGKFFAPILYTGTDATQVISVGFATNFVWIKQRSTSRDHRLLDILRGTNKYLISNLTDAEGTFAYLNSFDSNGFTLSAGDTSTNQTSGTYVAWNWAANGAGVSNTAGSITSTVSANSTSGFSVVTYTGTGSAATVGHGLGAVPQMIIVKSRSAVVDWVVYSAYNPSPRSNVLYLNGTQQALTVSNYWGTSDPTSSVFGLNTFGGNNASGGTYVAYCFAAVAGYSAFGNYTGNGSANGPFVFTNLRPAYIMVKRTDTTDQWTVYDSARNSSNLTNRILYPNLSNAEDVGTDGIDMLSNGFKVRATYSNLNASGGAYIYIAFASNPFKYSLAR